jgi:hypothetical protein
VTNDHYSFNQQLCHGEHGEEFLDHYFSRWFYIEPANPEEQRLGIDRFFMSRNQKHRLAVEYKTDETASRTGNAFIEVVSVDSSGKAGWAYTSQADYLLYYVPPRAFIYMLKMADIRERLSLWHQKYPLRRIPNNGYFSHGLLVPLRDLERYAEGVFNADECPPL